MKENNLNQISSQLPTSKFILIIFSQFIFVVIGFLIFASSMISGAFGTGNMSDPDYQSLYILFGLGAVVSILGSVLVWIIAYMKIYNNHSRKVILSILSAVIPVIGISFFIYFFLMLFVIKI